MSPRLRVLAGTSPQTMVPITSLVNTNAPHRLSSSFFEGQIVVHIHGLVDEKGGVRDSEYFGRDDRRGITWSIQVQGRFLVPYSSDDILFGNTFDRPLKLPWGTSAVLKFMNYIDPTLEHDLMSSTKPWALSPLIATMPHFAHKRVEVGGTTSEFPGKSSLKDDTSELFLAVNDGQDSSPGGSDSSPASSASSLSSTRSFSNRSAWSSQSHLSGHTIGNGSVKSTRSSGSQSLKGVMRKVAVGAVGKTKGKKSRRNCLSSQVEREVKELNGASERRSYFASREKRKDVFFGPEDLITTDFCYGFINFAPSLSLQLPGGLSFDLMKYWDGQPVRFVCCQRKGSGSDSDGCEGDDPWGGLFWCVAIEMVDSEDE